MKTKPEFLIWTSFDEKDHSIVEKWICTPSNLKKTLCGALDLFLGKNKNPVKPSLKAITKSLKDYADEEFIKNEFKRLDANWKTYKISNL